MTPVILTIPDDADELPAWLERRLVGPELARLVAELEAVHGPGSGGAESVDELLGAHRTEVLTRGLDALPRESLQSLLRRPQLLLDLQELVLLDGGTYWVSRSLASTSPSKPPPSIRGRRAWLAAVVLAVAAAAVVFLFFLPSRAEPRGWQKASAFAPGQLSAAAYLNHLADAVEEHRSAKPQEAEALARRIGEIRDGCTRFALARHQPLSDADRADVKTRCRRWSDRLDEFRKQLEDNPSESERIHGEVNALVEQMAKVLRTKAASLSA